MTLILGGDCTASGGDGGPVLAAFHLLIDYVSPVYNPFHLSSRRQHVHVALVFTPCSTIPFGQIDVPPAAIRTLPTSFGGIAISLGFWTEA